MSCIQCPSMYTPPVYKECPSSSSSVQGVSKLVNMLCTNWALAWARVNFQAVSKLGHSNFHSSDGSRQNGSRANGKTPQKQSQSDVHHPGIKGALVLLHAMQVVLKVVTKVSHKGIKNRYIGNFSDQYGSSRLLKSITPSELHLPSLYLEYTKINPSPMLEKMVL